MATLIVPALASEEPLVRDAGLQCLGMACFMSSVRYTTAFY